MSFRVDPRAPKWFACRFRVAPIVCHVVSCRVRIVSSRILSRGFGERPWSAFSCRGVFVSRRFRVANVSRRFVSRACRLIGSVSCRGLPVSRTLENGSWPIVGRVEVEFWTMSGRLFKAMGTEFFKNWCFQPRLELA